jgi:hypothetical protein
VSSAKGSVMKRLLVAGSPVCLVPGVVAAASARPISFAVVPNFLPRQSTQKWLTTLSETGTDIAFGRCRRTGVEASGINVSRRAKSVCPPLSCARATLSDA